MRAFALAVAALTAGTAFAQDMLPEGHPPKMGDIRGTMGGAAVAWETYDFSVGAYDGSAWADLGWETKQVMVHLMGYPPDNPDEMAGRIFIEGNMGAQLRTGEAADVAVSVMQGDDLDGPRLSSEAQGAVLVLDTVGPAVEDSYNRQVSGRVSAKLCPVDWPGQECRLIELHFDTAMQMESTLPVAP